MCGGEYRGARQGTEKSGNQAQYLPEKAKKLPRILIFGGPPTVVKRRRPLPFSYIRIGGSPGVTE